MRIALDATPLTLSSGGLARYVLELSTALARTFPEDEIYLTSGETFSMPQPAFANLHASHAPRNLFERRWWIFGLNKAMRRDRIDVFHGTNFEVPFPRLRPAVMSVHDMSPWMNPDWHHAAGRVRKRAPWLIRSGAATMVLTLTEAVRRQAIEHFKLPPDRVRAVPLAASPNFRPMAAEPEAKPYFLFVGTLEPRKNVPRLIEAWRETRRERPVDLVLAGRRRADFPELPAEPGLTVLGEVPDSELPRLYSNALAFVYLSHYEGFGLPVLEAMQCGAMVIASNDPSILEVTGGGALHAGSPQDAVAAMRIALTRPDIVAEHRRKSLQRAAEFSWTRTARLTREVYAEAIARTKTGALPEQRT